MLASAPLDLELGLVVCTPPVGPPGWESSDQLKSIDEL
jgi:hypothetical protein